MNYEQIIAHPHCRIPCNHFKKYMSGHEKFQGLLFNEKQTAEQYE